MSILKDSNRKVNIDTIICISDLKILKIDHIWNFCVQQLMSLFIRRYHIYTWFPKIFYNRKYSVYKFEKISKLNIMKQLEKEKGGDDWGK
jgi:hypothetical protein